MTTPNAARGTSRRREYFAHVAISPQTDQAQLLGPLSRFQAKKAAAKLTRRGTTCAVIRGQAL